MKRCMIFLFALCLLLAGCAGGTSDRETFLIYYRTVDEESESALYGLDLEVDRSDYDAVFQLLKVDHTDQQLESLIPDTAALEDAVMENGILHLDLSPEYSTLTGVAQTVANSCIALTYCQIPEVYGVTITSDGEPMSEVTVLTPGSIMLSGGGGDVGEVLVPLYYPKKSDGIGYYRQTLTVAENQSAPEAILQALCQDPEGRELVSFLPDDMEDITLWTEEDICYINLNTVWVQLLEAGEPSLEVKLKCITNSICALDSVQSVQFLLDGAVLERWRDIGGDFPLEPDYEGCVMIDIDD